jgi:hypothetical protein
VIYLSTQRRALCVFAVAFLGAVSLRAQTSTLSSAPAIAMRDEGHHHLVFENSYVHIFFVEIPAHETTLFHHHDLPYISVPPGGSDTNPSAVGGSGAASAPIFARVGYAAGNFSHAVTNSGDATLRNVAIELVRPQGTVRNRCSGVLHDQPREICNLPDLTATNPSRHAPLFETDEILVESWEVEPATTTAALNDGVDMLIAGLTDVRITGISGVDSANALRGGELWIPAGSKPVFKTAPDRGGHLIAITFKDSAPVPH